MPRHHQQEMTTATSVLNTLPKPARLKRNQTGAFEMQLRLMDRETSDMTVKMISYGIIWADQSGRVGGTVSLALRRATPWQAAQLVAAMIRDGLTVSAPVPSWLNANALKMLA